MYKTKAELRRERMIAVDVNGITIIGEPEHLIMLGVHKEGDEVQKPPVFQHRAWISFNNTIDETDWGVHAVTTSDLIKAYRVIQDLPAVKEGELKNRVISMEFLQEGVVELEALLK